MSPRIALVAHSFADGGGISVFTKFLYTVLRESKRFEPEIISLATSVSDSSSVRLLDPRTWSKGLQLQIGTWQGLPYRHVGAVFSEFEFQRYRPRSILTDILNQFDLVQVVAGTPAWGWVAHRTKRPLCVFTATTITHDRASRLLEESGGRWMWLWAMTRLNIMIEDRVLRHADAIFAESLYTYDNLKRIVQPGRLLLGKPGVDTSFFKPARAEGQAYILAVGRFSDPRKNVRLLLEAYRHLHISNRSIPTLVLAGTPPQLDDMHYMNVLGIAEKVKIVRHPSQDELAELYRNAQFFVLSSNEEGLGIVILEAMASGLSVVSTDCGGPATAIVAGKTGLLTPVGDADALAKAMQSLWEQPELRRQMGQAGRQRVEMRFSIETAGQVYLDAYEQLLLDRSDGVKQT